MVFSYNWIQSFFDKKIPKPDKLVEVLNLRFAEVEKLTKKGNDFVLDIDVRPNRASDCFSHLGIAREVSAILGVNYKMPDFPMKKKAGLDINDFISVKVKDPKNCLRYTALLIKDIKVKESPKWIKERLEACNIRSINNIVDIANYVMLETGQPLHAFDLDKIEGKKIIIRKAEKKEKINTLDQGNYVLNQDVLVIADEKDPLAIAGIKGGKKAEINQKTKTIVLESACFYRSSIRKSVRELKLRTDASIRFDHGIDTNLTRFAISRAGFLIQKLAGGDISNNLIDLYSEKNSAKKIKLEFNRVNSLLGIKIPEKEVFKIVNNLGIKIIKKSKDSILTEIPTFRQDINIQEDLIEDIGRIYGYENIPSEFPVASLISPKKNLDFFWEDLIKKVLKEIGFSETKNYSFVSNKDVEFFRFKNLIELKNPISLDYNYLRPSLIPNLIKNIIKNQNDFNAIKIFELGRIFQQPKLEKKMISGIIATKESKPKDTFLLLKGVVDLILKSLSITDFYYNEHKPTPEDSSKSIWNLGKCAEIKADDKEIGFLGEISKKVLKNYNSKLNIFVFDLDFQEISRLSSEQQEYRPISKYPAAVRDLAVLVGWETKVDEVLREIQKTGGYLVRDVELFDIYEGKELPEGKKNLAFRIIYQSEDRTLSSLEIDNLQNKIIKDLEKNLNWEVRK